MVHLFLWKKKEKIKRPKRSRKKKGEVLDKGYYFFFLFPVLGVIEWKANATCSRMSVCVCVCKYVLQITLFFLLWFWVWQAVHNTREEQMVYERGQEGREARVALLRRSRGKARRTHEKRKQKRKKTTRKEELWKRTIKKKREKKKPRRFRMNTSLNKC